MMASIKHRPFAAVALAGGLVLGACKSSTPPPGPEVAAAPAAPAPRRTETKHANGPLGAANTAYERGDYASAVTAYEQILNRDPENLTARFNRAVALQKSGDTRGAKQAYREILQKNPEEMDAAVNLGAILRDEGKIDEAIDLYRKTLKQDEYNSRLLNNLSVLYRAKKQHGKAIEALHKLLMRDQNNVDAYKNLALVYFDEKKYKLAQTILGNALKMSEKAGKKDPDILVNLGMIHLALGDNGKAMAAFKEAVAIDPENVVANYDIGALALEHRDYDLAARSYQVVLKASPNDYDVNVSYGYALQGQQKLEEAAKQLERARVLKENATLQKGDTRPDDEQVVLQLWQIHQAANKPEVALKYAEEYLRMKNRTCKETDADEICGRYNGTKLMLQMAKQPAPDDGKKKKGSGKGVDDVFKDAPAEGDEPAPAPAPAAGGTAEKATDGVAAGAGEGGRKDDSPSAAPPSGRR